jgi:hypothetical protein
MKIWADEQLVDTCIKNGGDHFLVEIASKEFVDEIIEAVKSIVSCSNSRGSDVMTNV